MRRAAVRVAADGLRRARPFERLDRARALRALPAGACRRAGRGKPSRRVARLRASDLERKARAALREPRQHPGLAWGQALGSAGAAAAPLPDPEVAAGAGRGRRGRDRGARLPAPRSGTGLDVADDPQRVHLQRELCSPRPRRLPAPRRRRGPAQVRDRRSSYGAAGHPGGDRLRAAGAVRRAHRPRRRAGGRRPANRGLERLPPPEPLGERQHQHAWSVLAGDGGGPVDETGDDGALPVLGRVNRSLRHRLGRHPEDAGELFLRLLNAGNLRELGPHRAGTDCRQGHPSPLQLLVHRLAEAEHEGLRRRVRGGARNRLEGGGRGDVDHRASTARDHRRQVARLEVEQRLAVESKHRDEPLPVEVEHRFRSPEAGVVDQDLDLEPEALDLRDQPLAGGLVAEVGGDRLGAHPVVPAQLAGQRAKALLTPRHQGDAVPARCQLARDRLADPGGGARDQRGCRLGGLRERHGRRLYESPSPDHSARARPPGY